MHKCAGQYKDELDEVQECPEKLECKRYKQTAGTMYQTYWIKPRINLTAGFVCNDKIDA